jgi:hypothetical protein
MNCFSCRPVVQLSDDGKRLTKILENLTYGYTILAVLKLFFGDFNNFLNDILTILITILTFTQTNYFMASFLVLLSIFQSFFLSVTVLLIIQNYYFGFLKIGSLIEYIYLSILFASQMMNFFLVYYSFNAYREYKALFLDQHQISLLRNYSKI